MELDSLAMSELLNLIEIGSMEEYLKVIHMEVPIVLDFSASWCGPCKRIYPKLVELAQNYPGMMFGKIDIDNLEDLATQYQIQSVPTFKFILNGTEHGEVRGASVEKLEDFTRQLWDLYEKSKSSPPPADQQ